MIELICYTWTAR